MSEETNERSELLSSAGEQSSDNYAIAEQFTLLSKLMDIHGENSFKAKSYSSVAFAIERLPQPLAGMTEAEISWTKGIGDRMAKKVMEILQTGELKALQDLLQQTPEGVLEMMNIKGLGPKKVHVLWKTLHLSTLDELEQACLQNRVAAQKGFGEKTEQKILESLAFVRSSRGKVYYKHVEGFALEMQLRLQTRFPTHQTALTGEFRRQMEVISKLEWVTTISKEALKDFLLNEESLLLEEGEETLRINAGGQIELQFHMTNEKGFAQKLFETSSSEEFLAAWQKEYNSTAPATEEEIFTEAGIHFIPPFLRESSTVIERAKTGGFDKIVQTNSIKGLIHSHSNWSDGGYTIEQMAEELIRRGFEYMVISDHSKAASYANGLSEERIKEQHRYIDSLNQKFSPFKIFKGIECDILGDGSLDYDNEVLSAFDVVITSIHSNLDMEEDKAMMRLMGAITHPCTTILGHMTGRLLLRRKGYPVDHKAIIDACAKHKVVIEINAAPSRLDMDWRWIHYALEKDVLLSINPDAHALEEFDYIKYGTLVAQKGGLPASRNLSSFSLQEFEAYLAETRKKKVQS